MQFEAKQYEERIQHQQLYIMSQQEVLQELDQENKQLKKENQEMRRQLARIRTLLAQNGISSGIEVVDGLAALIIEHTGTVQSLKTKAIASISKLSEVSRMDVGRLQSEIQKLRAENKRLSQAFELSGSQHYRQALSDARAPSKQGQGLEFERKMQDNALNCTKIVEIHQELAINQLRQEQLSKLPIDQFRKKEAQLDADIQRHCERLRQAAILDDIVDGSATEEEIAKRLVRGEKAQ